MLRNAKLAALEILRSAGAFEAVANSKWRHDGLLILCYHGTALENEHQWRPAIYLAPNVREQRLQTLRARAYLILCANRAQRPALLLSERQEFVSWLEKEGVLSATTRDVGLVKPDDNPFLLSRFVDTTGRTQLEFESWLSGLGALIVFRRAAMRSYSLPED